MTDVRLRHLVKLGPRPTSASLPAQDAEVTFAPMDALSDGIGGLDTSLSRSFIELASGSYNFFAEGDLLLAKVTPCFENGKKAQASDLANGAGFATSEVYVIRPDRRRIEPRYLFYVLSSEDFRAACMASMTGAGGLRRVSEAAVLNYRPRVTDQLLQKAIADFLDHETVRIDQLIAKRKAFLALIEEKRASVGAQAINGSILGAKPTGRRGWFGTLPSSWSVRRAKFMFRERQERSDTGQEELLTVSHITGVTRRSEKDVNMFLAESNEGYKIVARGDVVINTMWAWMGAMGVSPENGLISPSYGVYAPITEDYEFQYLDLLLRSRPFVAEATRRSKGIHSSRLRLYPDAFLDISLPVGPKSDQDKVLQAVRIAMARDDELARLSRKSLDRLREFRSTLVTAAVTGQIDVANWRKRSAAGWRLDQIQEAERA